VIAGASIDGPVIVNAPCTRSVLGRNAHDLSRKCENCSAFELLGEQDEIAADIATPA
jgi:hypothetical protein